jgi:cytosine/uracil/thiamine/allantoin permease
MKLLRITVLTVVVGVPVAWIVLLILAGSAQETFSNIFLHTLILPVVMGIAGVGGTIWGVSRSVQQHRFDFGILG